KPRQPASVPARPGPLRARLAGVLPGPVQLPGAAILPGGPLLVMGGLDASDVSVASVAALRGASTSIVGQLPQPVHDAAAAALSHSLTHAAGASLNGTFYVIGGRSASLTSQTGSILGVDPRTGRSYGAGRLPRPLSDAAAVTDGARILLAGGRDTTGARAEIL